MFDIFIMPLVVFVPPKPFFYHLAFQCFDFESTQIANEGYCRSASLPLKLLCTFYYFCIEIFLLLRISKITHW